MKILKNKNILYIMSIKKYLIETDHLNEKSKKKDLPNF